MKNLILFFILSVILFFLCGLNNKNELTPLQFLSEKTELVVKKYRSDIQDTLDALEIHRLSELKFRKKGLDDENSEDCEKHSISLFENERKICHLEIREVDAISYSVTINNFKEHKLFRGYLIEKSKLETLLPLLKDSEF